MASCSPAALSGRRRLFTYTGGSQNWTDPLAWTKTGTATLATYPGMMAGETHDVVIGSGTATVALPLSSNSVRNVTVTGGLVVNAATTFSNAGGSITGAGTVTMEATLALAGNYSAATSTSVGGATLQFAKAINTTSASGNIALQYTGAVSSILTLSGSYASLTTTTGTLTSTSSYTLTQSLSLAGNYTHTSGTLTFTGTMLSGSGAIVLPNVVLNAATTIASTLTATVKGDFTQSGAGSLNSTNGRITFDKGAAMTLGGSGAGGLTFFNMTVGGTANSYLAVAHTLTIAGTATGTTAATAALGVNSLANNVFTLAAGITAYITGNGATLLTNNRLDGAVTSYYEINADNVTLKDATTFSNLTIDPSHAFSTDQSITLKYNLAIGASSSLTATSGTFTLSGTGQTVASSGSAPVFFNLTTAGSGIKSATTSFTVNGDMVIGSGTTVSAATNNITLKGNYTTSGALAQSGTGQFIFAGTAAQSLSVAGSTTTLGFRNITNANTAASVVASALVSVAANTVINYGTGFGVQSLSGQNLGTVSGTGTLQIYAAAGANTLFPNGTFTSFLPPFGTGTIEYAGNASYNVYEVPALGYYNIKIVGTGTKTLTQAIEVRGEVRIAGGATLSGGTVNITLFNGDFVNNGAFNGGTNGDVRFSSTAADQNITGTGIYNFQQLTMAKSGKAVVLAAPIRVAIKLNFETDGFLDLGTNDLTLSTGANVLTNTAFGTACMIRQNGSATGGAVVTEGAATTDFIGVVPVGTTGVYAPVSFTTLAATVTGTGSISVRTVPFTSAATNILKRYWRITTANISAVTDARFYFTYPSSEVAGTPNQVVRLDAVGTPNAVNGDFYDGISRFGINTSGNTFLVQDWYFQKLDLPIIYYSFASGNYSDPTIWTTDYNGVTWVNPPDAGGPDANDKIVILTAKTVTVDVNNTSPDSVQIRTGSILVLGTTTGHDFGKIEGSGTLRLSNGTLPTGTYGSFVQTGGGTIEYNGAACTLDATLNTYYHVKVLGTGAKLLSASAARTITVNGNFTAGTTQLTIGSAAFPITLAIAGNMVVQAGAAVRVGSFNAAHTIRIGGNFTSNGDVRLHNLSTPIIASYYTTLTTTGYATVEMVNAGTASISIATAECSFYFLRINKSAITDVVTLTPTRKAYFTLYGKNDQADAGIDVAASLCTKALRPDVGTLILDDSVSIPSLTEGNGMFRIGINAEIYLKGYMKITTTSTLAYKSEIAPYGRLRIRGGTLAGGTGMGLRLLYTGQFLLESGTVTLSQVSTYRSAGLGVPSGLFSVSGGTLNVDGSGATDLFFARMDILWNSITTSVTAGTVNIRNPVGNATSFMKNGGLLINSTTVTYTGGTWNLYLPAVADANQNFGINVNGGLWTVNMYNEGTYTSSVFMMTSMVYSDNGNTGTAIASRSLTVSTSLSQQAYASLNMATKDLTIGANWYVAATGGYTPGATLTQKTGLGEGITGQGTACTISLNYPSPTFNILEFNNNAAGSAYTLSGNDITCNSDARFYSGTINQNGINIYTYASPRFQVTHAGPGKVVMMGAASGTVYANNSGLPWEFEIRLTPTGGVYPVATLNNALTVKSKLILTSGIFELGSQNLTTSIGCHLYNTSSDSAQAAFGITNMITTNGTGKLIRNFSAAFKSLVWPIGTGTPAGGTLKYRPVLNSVTGATAYGNASFQARNSQHPNVTIPPATVNDALNYYWYESSAGWTSPLGISITFVYNAADIPPSGITTDDNAYVMGHYNYATPNFWTNNAYATQGADVATKNYYGNGDYTVGNAVAFGGLIEYWSIRSGSWGRASTWRRKQNGNWIDITPAYSSTAPIAGSAVVIQDNMTVNIKDSVPAISIVTLNMPGTNSVLDIDTTLSKWAHNFGTVLASNGKFLLSYGKTGVRAPGGNWSTLFAGNNNTVTFYTKGAAFQIPKSWTANYRYLILKPEPLFKITLPDTLMTVASDFSILPATSGSVYASSATNLATNGDLTVNGVTTIGTGASFIFPATVARTWKNNGGSIALNGRILTDTATGYSPLHRLELRYNITSVAGSSFDWQPGSVTVARGYIYWNNGTAAFIQGTSTLFRLNNITMAKTAGVTGEVGVNNFQLKGDASLATALKPITMTTGILRLNTLQTAYGGKWMLNSGNNPVNDFKIPNNSGLEFVFGNAVVSATGTNAGLTLEGRLALLAGTKCIINSNATTDSYLQTSTSAGTPTLEMGGDSLIIGGQFRSATGTARACSLTFSAGVTVVARTNVLVTTKPIFEIPASSYGAFTGGKIIICRSLGTASIDVTNGATSGTVTGGLFQYGHSVTPTGTTFRTSLYNYYGMSLTAAGQAAKPALVFGASAASFLGDVTTDAGTSMTMAGNATFGGNFTAYGSYNGAAYQSQFTGQGRDQTLTAPAGFTVNTLRYTPSLSTSQLLLSVAGTVSVVNFTIDQGTVSSGAATVTVTGNVINYGTHTSTSGQLNLNGSGTQTTCTNGLTATYGNVNINNSLGVKSIGNMSLTGNLTLTQGVFDIDTSYLYLSATTSILNGNATAYSGSKCIHTAGRLQDGGINKDFASGTFAIVFPLAIGATAPYSYVPASYTATANTASGTIGIRPVNRSHPATTDASNKELAFYWAVSSSGFAGLAVTQTYTYLQTMQNGRGTEASYIPARYTGSWNTGIGSINTTSNVITVNGSGTGVSYISGDYTAGEFTEFSNGATYLSNGTGGGSWYTAASWQGNAVPPTGAQVRIRLRDVITIGTNGVTQSTVTVDTNAILDAGVTTGHDFGAMYGTGTLALSTSTFPSGNFGTFSSAGGGTVEFDGAGYTITSLRSVYNNLRIKSSGIIDMANLATTVNGDLTVAQGTFRNINNKKLIVRGNVSNSSGATFTAGSSSTNENLELYGNFANSGTFTAGNTVTIFRGSTTQYISGTQNPYFSTLQVNKPSGNVRLQTGITVGKQVTLTQGIIRLLAADLTVWDTTFFKPDNITSVSFLDAHKTGMIKKRLTATSSLPIANLQIFPVGDSLLYTPVTINVQNMGYIGSSGSLNVNVNQGAHPNKGGANRFLKRYWRVQGTALAGPVMDITYKYASGEIQDNYPADLRSITSARYTGSEWEAYSAGYDPSSLTFNYPTATRFGDYTGGTGMGDAVPLPVTLAGLAATALPQGISVTWVTLSEAGSDGFGIERSVDGGHTFTRIGYAGSKAPAGISKARLAYQWLDKSPPAGTIYYRLQQQDRDGNTSPSNTVESTWQGSRLPKFLTVAPNPSDGKIIKAIFGGLADSPATASITDALGRNVWHGAIEPGSRGELDLASLAGFGKGVYMLTLTTAEDRLQVRFVVR